MNKKIILGYAIGPIGIALLGFISLPITTWFFSVEDIGRISMLQIATSFLILTFSLGLDQAYVREYHPTKDKTALLKTTLIPGLTIVIFICSLIYLYKPGQLSKWLYDIPDKQLTKITILCFISAFISRFLSLILRMNDRSFAYSFSQLLPKVLFLALLGLTAIYISNKEFKHLIAIHSVSIVTVFLIFSWSTRHEWLQAINKKIKIEQLKNALLFGLPLMIAGIASWGLNVMDKIFLRAFSDFEELGIYSISISIAGVAAIFSGIFNIIWAPMVYKWENEKKDLDKINDVTRYLLAAVFFIIALSGSLSWLVSFILPREYMAVQYLIPSCLIAPLLYSLSETSAVGIALARKSSYSMFCSISAMIINGIGNFLLVPNYGAAGASISTGFAFVIFYILRTEFSNKTKSYTIRHRFLTYSTIIFLFIMSTIHASLFLTLNKTTIFNSIQLFWLCCLIAGLFFFKNEVTNSFHFIIKIKSSQK